MTFDDLLESVSKGDDVLIPASWAQGRASFGGLTAALVFDRMAEVAEAGRPMRSLQVSFVGPVKPEVPAKVSAEVLREGKAVSQVLGRIEQEGQAQLVAMASFGGDRESSVQVSGLPAPSATPPEECQALPYIKNVTPEFTQHIDMRWSFGGLPFSGKVSREMGGWMRFREPPAQISDAHIVALIDGWPPALLPHLKTPAPASSLSWAMDLVYPRPEIRPDEWLLYRATIDQASGGYGMTQAGIWTQRGELVATSRQTVTVFG